MERLHTLSCCYAVHKRQSAGVLERRFIIKNCFSLNHLTTCRQSAHADEGSSPSVVPTILIHVAQPRPRRLDNRNIIASNTRDSVASNNRDSVASITTSNPFRGESLFASTEQPVYRLEPSPEEREPGERWSPFFNGKEGDGG